jgi:hypothetical protein
MGHLSNLEIIITMVNKSELDKKLHEDTKCLRREKSWDQIRKLSEVVDSFHKSCTATSMMRSNCYIM